MDTPVKVLIMKLLAAPPWKRLPFRIALLGCLFGAIGFLHQVRQNGVVAAALPTMALSTPTNAPELNPAQTDPTLEASLTTTPVLGTATSPAEAPTHTPTPQAPAATATPQATLSVTPTATLSATWMTPLPTLTMTATATLQPVEMRGDYLPGQAVVRFSGRLKKEEIRAIAESLQAGILEEIPELDAYVLAVPP